MATSRQYGDTCWLWQFFVHLNSFMCIYLTFVARARNRGASTTKENFSTLFHVSLKARCTFLIVISTHITSCGYILPLLYLSSWENWENPTFQNKCFSIFGPKYDPKMSQNMPFDTVNFSVRFQWYFEEMVLK